MPAQPRVFVLTGAGISAESGIRTFRDGNGLWEEHRVEDVASPEGFVRDPQLVWRFYGARREQALEVAPNPAHAALAMLESRLGERLFLCTQNVDSLHERAGSKRLVHMHGELFRSRCSDPNCDERPFEDTRFTFRTLPRCECGALERPDIVWFGEIPFHMPIIHRELNRADVFITVGSSGAVYPAAGFVHEINARQARGEACTSIYVGLERPDNHHAFDRLVLGKAGEVLPPLLAEFA